MHNTDKLKQCLQQMWRKVDQSIIDNETVRGASVQANGGHFEHML